ncbi:unnamed protein product [Brassicogethes aeneus]|uniref:THAP-type domain-containing protein n=2 Tax=Brassicogethes aeneus TaxID=1431903 RepID=A0A9P0B0I2_BRAAE|nr:unnamed protein product [Brassicogethes aeneus]
MVKSCKNNNKNNKELKFFTLPKNSLKAKEWIEAAGNSMVNMEKPKSHRICAIHFEQKYLVRHPHEVLYGLLPPKAYRGLTENAVPTLHLPERSETLEMVVDLPNEATCAKSTKSTSSCSINNAKVDFRYYF